MSQRWVRAEVGIAAIGLALAIIAKPSWAQCPYGPDQCKPGLVWRDAFTNDHVCVTGAERSQALADNQLAPQRVLANGYCRPGFVWREANPSDHVCVTGATRSQVSTQNNLATQNVDPICRDPAAGLNLRTEYLRKPSGQIAAKPSYSFTTLLADGSVVGVNRGPLAIATDLMWAPGTVIKVSITGGSNSLRSRIQQYATEWSKWGNIRFKFIADAMQAEIRAEINDDKSSWSRVGRETLSVPAPEKTMNFGWLTDATSDTEVSRVVQHEFGHALGMIHEHQSPAAGIPWDRDKVLAYYRRTYNWDDAKIEANVLNQAPAASTNYSQYDPSSIMQYAIDAGLTTNGYSVGWNNYLSAVDKQFFGTFYPYPPGSKGTVFTGDDCDTIAFDLVNGVQNQDGARFVLRLGPSVTWWKRIGIPTQGGGYVEIESHDAISGETTIAFANMDQSRPIRFSKAKFLDIHTGLSFTWPMLPAVSEGSRLILDWNRDTCR